MLTCARLQCTTKQYMAITITQLCKHVTSQFDDQLITGHGKMITRLKK